MLHKKISACSRARVTSAVLTDERAENASPTALAVSAAKELHAELG